VFAIFDLIAHTDTDVHKNTRRAQISNKAELDTFQSLMGTYYYLSKDIHLR